MRIAWVIWFRLLDKFLIGIDRYGGANLVKIQTLLQGFLIWVPCWRFDLTHLSLSLCGGLLR